MGENVASALNMEPSAGQGPEVATPEARRAAFVEMLRALGVESAELVAQKTALGRTKGDAKTRDAIQARLADIEDATADYQKLLAAVNFELKEAAAPTAAGRRNYGSSSTSGGYVNSGVDNPSTYTVCMYVCMYIS